MQFWITVWGLVLAFALTLYAGLFVWVTLGGLSDIRAMLASLDRQHEKPTTPPDRP